MNKKLSPATLGIIGFILLALKFIGRGVVIDLLGVLGVILVVVGFIGILLKNFRRKKEITPPE